MLAKFFVIKLSTKRPVHHFNMYRSTTVTVLQCTHPAGKPSISPSTVALRSHKERPSFTCSVNYTGGHAPNITWMYVKDRMELALNEGDYLSESSCTDKEGGMSTKHSTLTSLNLDLPVGKSAIVRCKVGHGLQRATADAFVVNINGQGIYTACNSVCEMNKEYLYVYTQKEHVRKSQRQLK